MDIRAATEDDVTAIYELAAARGFDVRHTGMLDNGLLHHIVEQEFLGVFVAVDEPRLLGFVVIRALSLLSHRPDENEATLDACVVADDSLWPTVGQSLLASAFELSRERGAARVYIETDATSLPPESVRDLLGMVHVGSRYAHD